MLTTIRLNQMDIEELIANSFRTKTDKVSIEVKKKMVGYAQNEHEEPEVEAVILLDDPKPKFVGLESDYLNKRNPS